MADEIKKVILSDLQGNENWYPVTKLEYVEGSENKVSWSDEYKNRIVLPYDGDENRPGEGAGQIIGYANPECKEGGKVWSDSWKEQETIDGHVGVSPNVYNPEKPSVVLVQMSKYNVQEYGSTTYPINLQGSKVRPTYNDNDEIALLKDVNDVQGNLESNIQGVQGQIETLNGKVNTLESKHGQDIIGIQGQIKDLEKKHDDDIKLLLDDENATEKLDSFKEVADWIEKHGTQATEFISEINDKVDGIKKELDDTIDGVQSRITTLEGKHNDEISGVQSRITTLEGKHDNEISGVQSEVTEKLKGYYTKSEVDAAIKKAIDDFIGEYNLVVAGVQD